MIRGMTRFFSFFKEREAAAVFHDFIKFFSNNFDTFVTEAQTIQRMF